MITVFEDDQSITIEEIHDLMDRYDTADVFKTRHRYPRNFKYHFSKLQQAHQILTLRDDENNYRIEGMCSWALVTPESKKDLNKVTWALPEDVSTGTILYVDVLVLKNQIYIYRVKNILQKKYRDFVKEVFAFYIPGERVIRGKVFPLPQERIVHGY